MSTKGFAHPSVNKEKHRQLSSEAGKVKNPNKGFGSLTKEERSIRASEGAKARWAKVKAERQSDETD